MVEAEDCISMLVPVTKASVAASPPRRVKLHFGTVNVMHPLDGTCSKRGDERGTKKVLRFTPLPSLHLVPPTMVSAFYHRGCMVASAFPPLTPLPISAAVRRSSSSSLRLLWEKRCACPSAFREFSRIRRTCRGRGAWSLGALTCPRRRGFAASTTSSTGTR